MRIATVIGNPRTGSRTRKAADRLAERLGAASPEAVELAVLGPDLLDWKSAAVAEAMATVQGCDVAIFASPTFKGTFTGLMKLFLDRFDTGTGLGNIAVPLMLGGDMRHSLAPDVFLRPVLVELGASCPTASLFHIDSTWETDPQLEPWLERWKPVVEAAVGARQTRSA